MTTRLDAILAGLVQRSRVDGFVHIDDFAEALGELALTTDEIDSALQRFEDGGGVLRAPEGGGGQGRLKIVLDAARTLATTLGRVPSSTEIAEHTGMPVEQVRNALALGRVMGR